MPGQSTLLEARLAPWLLLAASAMALGCDASAPPARGMRDVRLAVCGSEAAERIVALGAGASIRAADVASLTIPGVGAAANLGPACSDVAELAPGLALDLAILTGSSGGQADRLEALGLRTRVLAPGGLNEVVRIHHDLGGLLGREERASILIARMTREISAIATRRDGTSRRRVAWLVQHGDGPGGWLAVGAMGMLHEILELAGADNAFHAPATPRIPVDASAIAATEPDLVLVGSDLPAAPELTKALPVERVSSELSRLPLLDPLPRIRRLHDLLYPDAR